MKEYPRQLVYIEDGVTQNAALCGKIIIRTHPRKPSGAKSSILIEISGRSENADLGINAEHRQVLLTSQKILQAFMEQVDRGLAKLTQEEGE